MFVITVKILGDLAALVNHLFDHDFELLKDGHSVALEVEFTLRGGISRKSARVAHSASFELQCCLQRENAESVDGFSGIGDLGFSFHFLFLVFCVL